MAIRIPSPYSPSFSEVVAVDGPGRWVYVSGHVGTDADGNVPTDDPQREADLCLGHVRSSLEKAGARMEHVVRITAYLTDLGRYAVFSEARARAFGDSAPASAAIGVADLLLGAWLEVDAVAFVPEAEIGE